MMSWVMHRVMHRVVMMHRVVVHRVMNCAMSRVMGRRVVRGRRNLRDRGCACRNGHDKSQ